MANGLAHARLKRERIEAAVMAMPALRRSIFLAVALKDASYAEIGRLVGLVSIAVEHEFARALVDLAAAIDPRPSWWQRLRRWVAVRAGGSGLG